MNQSYPEPPRQTIDDLDPASATTDHLIAMIRSHREGVICPTQKQLLDNFPVALQALCDHALTGQATAPDVAYRLASIIDAVENCPAPPASNQRRESQAGSRRKRRVALYFVSVNLNLVQTCLV